jgi:hypothetical protein
MATRFNAFDRRSIPQPPDADQSDPPRSLRLGGSFFKPLRLDAAARIHQRVDEVIE